MAAFQRILRSKWAARGLKVAFGLTIGLVLAELILRLAGLASPSPYRPDPICGARLKSNYSGWHTTEGVVHFQTNRDGFRDRHHEIEKPGDTVRIAVLGDSYCEALQVEREEAFWSVLEQQLNRRQVAKGKRVEVLNTGVSGYGTAQELLTLRHRMWQFEPDIVLLAFLTGNDIRNNSRALEGDKHRPYFVLRHGRLELDNSFLDEPFFTSKWIRAKDRLIQSSRLLTLAYRVKHRRRDASPGEAGLDNFIYREPQTPEQAEAWIVTEMLIESMHREVQSRGAHLVVATLTNGIQVHPQLAARDRFARSLGVTDLGYADRRIQRLSQRLGIPCVVLARPLGEYAARHNVFLHGFENATWGEGHWNATGHRVAGRILADYLADRWPID